LPTTACADGDRDKRQCGEGHDEEEIAMKTPPGKVPDDNEREKPWQRHEIEVTAVDRRDTQRKVRKQQEADDRCGIEQHGDTTHAGIEIGGG
jgi:cell division protein FtsN